MRRAIASHGPSALMAAAACLALAWLGLYGFAWNDYDNEARPAVQALLEGHVSTFLALAPAYGGSLIERAPFAFLAELWGGGSLAVYRLLALPCLLASAVLGVWLVSGMRADGRPPLARGVALAVCVANPLTLRALEIGHPEELLGGVLCVFAVVLAARGRVLWAAVLLGLAIANKEWALLAAGPVWLALPRGRRVAPMALAGTISAILIAPFLLAGAASFDATTKALASSASPIFQPWQVWWFLGHHGPLVHGLFGEAKPGYRTPPAWVSRVSHPLIILTGALLTAGVALRRRGARLSEGDGLLALAVLLLLRCVLDSWDAVYYPLPFVLALVTWEARRPGRQPPVLALAATVLVWLSFQWLPGHASPDVQAAVFMGWSLPLVGALALRLFARPGRGAPADHEQASRGRPPQEMTVSSLGSLVRTS
jgi:hypothetical protein